jgi:K+-sensing histidine kinase KdpD
MLVDQALSDLVATIDTTHIHIDDQIDQLDLKQDRHLLSQVMETIISSMYVKGQDTGLTIGGGKTADYTILNVTGPTSDDIPAENLFSVYASSNNESAGTAIDPNDSSMQRLDLYLDRMIVSSLGGSIEASKSQGKMKVEMVIPG